MLQRADSATRQQARTTLNNGQADRVTALRDLARQAGSLRYAEGLAHRYVHSAVENLSDLPPGLAKDALIQIAEHIPTRRR